MAISPVLGKLTHMPNKVVWQVYIWDLSSKLKSADWTRPPERPFRRLDKYFCIINGSAE